MTIRKIIHIDMDAFFASVEQRDFPELRGKPVIVGGPPNSRSVVATCSYEARKYGIHSAMATAKAKRLCPHAVFLRPRFEVYRQVSQKIRQIMLTVTPLVEPLSLDEAYLDVTDSNFYANSATRIAEYLRATIQQQTRLTASAGISYNKMLAKIASDLNKPNGMAVILPQEGASFAAGLPVEKFHGIGRATAAKMHELGIKTGADMRDFGEKSLIKYFGKLGSFYYNIAMGNDTRPVRASRVCKSIASEATFAQDLHNDDDILAALFAHNQEAFHDLQSKNMCARTVSIKIKYNDFSQITRSHSVTPHFFTAKDASLWVEKMYQNTAKHLPVRLVGVGFSNLIARSDNRQLTLF